MSLCPRCGNEGYERLRSHSYCLECNYSEIPEAEEVLAIPKWVSEVLSVSKKTNDDSNHTDDPIFAVV
jgi:hypothetical protein